MDYEKEYYEMVRRCKELHESGNALTKRQMEIVCPQLADDDEIIVEAIKGAICNAVMDEETRRGALSWLEKQKEQKPASTEDMPYITDEHFYEREPADSFKYKLAEYMTRCCTKKEGPYGYEYGISAESILKMAEEELLKRGVVQKPVDLIKGVNGVPCPSGNQIVDVSPTEWSEKHIADVFEKVGLSKIVREIGNDDLTNAVQSAMLELSKGYKQDWSEEDEEYISSIISTIEM